MAKRTIGRCTEESTIIDKAFFMWLHLNHIDVNTMISVVWSSLRTIQFTLCVCTILILIFTVLAISLYDIKETMTNILYAVAIIVFAIWTILYIRKMKMIREEIKKWMNSPSRLQDYRILCPRLYWTRIRFTIIDLIINCGMPGIIRDRTFLTQQMKMVLESFDRYSTNKTDFNDDFFNAYVNLINTIASGVAIVLLTTIGLELFPIKIIVLIACCLTSYISLEYFRLYTENQIDHVYSILANRCAKDLRMAYEYVIDQCKQ